MTARNTLNTQQINNIHYGPHFDPMNPDIPMNHDLTYLDKDKEGFDVIPLNNDNNNYDFSNMQDST